jgi:hypothetical protein
MKAEPVRSLCSDAATKVSPNSQTVSVSLRGTE